MFVPFVCASDGDGDCDGAGVIVTGIRCKGVGGSWVIFVVVVSVVA